MKPSYEALGDIISALNHIDQAQSEFPRHSYGWSKLGEVYRQLKAIDFSYEYPEDRNLWAEQINSQMGGR
jgi:hypothetical protein